MSCVPRFKNKFKDDPSTFLATDNEGAPMNFVTAIHKETYYPKAQTICARRPIPVQNEIEKKGDKYRR